ncbi:MAG TPA: WecB/TagA/CpsF family glycosyltransferase [Bacteroidota bacterium]|nr:WecB/TagA/CpsF family glycosyltransferase [Bacteroidota bacterium]
MANNIDILGIPFCVTDYKDIIDSIRQSVKTKSALTIVQPHFFHTVLGRADSALVDLYRKYDIILPDGYGIFTAGRFLYGRQKAFKRLLNGTDLYELLLQEANAQHWRIFFLGDTEIVVRALGKRIRDRFPGIGFAGAHHGFIDLEDEAVVRLIKESNADVLLVGMGTPKQDYWLWKHHDGLHVPVSIVVGGGIGYISREKKRAPKVLRAIHLEWLFRLFQEPRRLWNRYLFGIPKFIFYVVLQKVRQP